MGQGRGFSMTAKREGNLKLKHQVCNIKLATQLKELGVTFPSIFFFEWTGAKPDEIEMNNGAYHNIDNVNTFTVSELGVMLPQQTGSQQIEKGEWSCVKYVHGDQ